MGSALEITNEILKAARLQLASKNRRATLDLLIEAKAKAGKDEAALEEVGNVMMEAAEYGAAADVYRAISNKSKGSYKTQVALFDARSRVRVAKDRFTAITISNELEQCITSKDFPPELMLLVGQIFKRLQEIDKAEKAMLVGFEMGANQPEAATELIRLHILNRELQRSSKFFVRASSYRLDTKQVARMFAFMLDLERSTTSDLLQCALLAEQWGTLDLPVKFANRARVTSKDSVAAFICFWKYRLRFEHAKEAGEMIRSRLPEINDRLSTGSVLDAAWVLSSTGLVQDEILLLKRIAETRGNVPQINEALATAEWMLGRTTQR